jgi:hypothetical protein
MMRSATTVALLAALATACGGGAPTREEVEEARGQIEVAMSAATQARAALELLGILPEYTCGEPRRSFVGRATESRATESLQEQVGCVSARTEPWDAVTDAVVLTFPEEGCAARGHTVSGYAPFKYSGGEDRMELKVDLRELRVDGEVLPVEVGYGTCGDESRYFALAEGPVPQRPDHAYRVDGRLGKRDGIPILGGTSLVFNGPGELTGPEGTSRLTLTELEYELGEYAPKEGEVLLETADGHSVKATFRQKYWRLGEMELTVDEHEPVVVPVVR